MDILDVTGLTGVHTAAKYRLGSRYTDEAGNQYRYVYVDDNVDVTAGMYLSAADNAVVGPFSVTPDRSGGSALVKALTNANAYPGGGIAMFAADVSEDERYGWILVDGYVGTYGARATFLTDGTAVKGSPLIPSDTDGALAIAVFYTDHDPTENTWAKVGFADADDSATAGTGYISTGW